MRPAPAPAVLPAVVTRVAVAAIVAVAALAALAGLAALAVPAAAQPAIDAGYEVRLARGDIPTTDAAEGDGWNLRLDLTLPAAGAQNVTLPLPAGFRLDGAGCTCANATANESAGQVVVHVPADAPAGSAVHLAASAPAGRLAALDLPLPDAARPEDAFLAVYAPEGSTVESDLDLAQIDCTTGDCTVHFYESSAAEPLPTTLWVAVHPASGAADPTPPTVQDDGFDWLSVGLGALAGVALWAVLVQRGVVQKRARKQVAAEAPHDALAKEGKPSLEARKRALMAALKELEIAKMNQEVEVPAYDAVKADLKRQTVAVMRALESAA